MFRSVHAGLLPIKQQEGELYCDLLQRERLTDLIIWKKAAITMIETSLRRHLFLTWTKSFLQNDSILFQSATSITAAYSDRLLRITLKCLCFCLNEKWSKRKKEWRWWKCTLTACLIWINENPALPFWKLKLQPVYYWEKKSTKSFAFKPAVTCSTTPDIILGFCEIPFSKERKKLLCVIRISSRGVKIAVILQKKLSGMVLWLIGAVCIHYSKSTYFWRSFQKVNIASVLYPSYPGCWDQLLLPQGPGSLEEDWLLGELR